MHDRRRPLLFAAPLLGLLVVITCSAEDLPQLTPGAVIERQITSPQVPVYAIALAPGQLLELSLEEKLLDTGLELRDPEGKMVARSNRKRLGGDCILFEAHQPGTYRVSVTTSAARLTGSYRLRCELKQRASERDRNRIAAIDMAEQAYELLSRSTAVKAAEIINFSNRAIQIWDYLNDTNEKAYSLLTIVRADRLLGKHEDSIAIGQQALNLFRSVNNLAGEASVLAALGVAYGRMSKLQESLEFVQSSLKLARQLEDLESEAARYSDLGATYVIYGDYLPSTEALNASLKLSRKLGLAEAEGRALGNLCGVANLQDRFEKAVQYCEEAVGVLSRNNLKYFEAMALISLGRANEGVSEFQKALEAYEQSLAIRHELNDRDGEIMSHDSIARNRYCLGALRSSA